MAALQWISTHSSGVKKLFSESSLRKNSKLLGNSSISFKFFYNGTYVDVDILSILFTLQKISYSSAEFLYRQYHAYVYMSVHALYVGTR